jgi:hypothetical protein
LAIAAFITLPLVPSFYSIAALKPQNLLVSESLCDAKDALGGDVLVWINPQNLPLQKSGGNVDLLSHLQTLKAAGAAGEWRVCRARPSKAESARFARVMTQFKRHTGAW